MREDFDFDFDFSTSPAKPWTTHSSSLSQASFTIFTDFSLSLIDHADWPSSSSLARLVRWDKDPSRLFHAFHRNPLSAWKTKKNAPKHCRNQKGWQVEAKLIGFA